MKLIFASANKNKIKEIKALLPETFDILGLEDIGITEDIPEPGTTIKENSFLKSQYVLDFLKQKNEKAAVFSDDSGLEVLALNNAPGVYSARYAGVPKNDANNSKKLLEELKLVTDRKARFVTVITLIINDQIHYFEGEIKGTISYEARGTNGFGYDPLFIPQGYRSTFAELGDEVKNSISHRALAVKKLIQFFQTQN
jgi:XTP/dITP diphosphohydrolase